MLRTLGFGYNSDELNSTRQNLIRILQSAYSGELAAAYAYRGHWKSLKPSPEKTHIERIENEEWRHRENVASWLEHLEQNQKNCARPFLDDLPGCGRIVFYFETAPILTKEGSLIFL